MQRQLGAVETAPAGIMAHRGETTTCKGKVQGGVVVLAQGVTEALTADHHFEQAGFTAPLK